MATHGLPDDRPVSVSIFDRFVAAFRARRTKQRTETSFCNVPFCTRLDVKHAKTTAARCLAYQRVAFAKIVHPRLGSQSTAALVLHEMQLLESICELNRYEFGRWDLFGSMLLQHKNA